MSRFNLEAVAVEVRASGLLEGDDEALLLSLRERGLSLVQSIVVLAKTRHIPLSDAKEVAIDSRAWSADFAANVQVQDEIEGAFRAEQTN